MTNVPIVNQRATVKAVFVGNDEERDYKAGEWNFYSSGDIEHYGILFGCPCGCGSLLSIPFKSTTRPNWEWDGNEDKPTVTPSILNYQMNKEGKIIGEHWHGFLTAGVFKSC